LGCQKGKLYPALTASGNPVNAVNSAASTYQYTNAVLQCVSFNTGQWRVWEGNIRTFAVQTCLPAGGKLYLITGISFVAIQNTQPPQPIEVPVIQFAPGIDKPNSVWTAGTCLYPNGQCVAFAVIGNNVLNPPGKLTQQITLEELTSILQFDIQTNNLKRDRSSLRVQLFPGVRSCSYERLPREETPPRSSSYKPPGSSSYPPGLGSSSKYPSFNSKKQPSSKY